MPANVPSTSASRSRVSSSPATRTRVAVNAGFYESAQAVSIAAEGVVGYNVFSPGDRVAVSGGVGVGIDNGRGDNVVGGRVGGQITWR